VSQAGDFRPKRVYRPTPKRRKLERAQSVTERSVDPAGTVSLRNVSDPDVPEAEGLALVAVCLKLDRRAVIFLVERLPDIQRLSL